MRIDPKSPTTLSLPVASKDAAHGLEARATDPKLRKAAEGIEASFIKTLMEQMQKGSSMFGKAAGAGIYQEFFNQAVAESMASKSQFGIADMIEKQMAPRLAAINNDPENNTNGNA